MDQDFFEVSQKIILWLNWSFLLLSRYVAYFVFYFTKNEICMNAISENLDSF
jgi:hypothetical protein